MMVVCDALDTLFEDASAEVDQQAKRKAHEPEIGEQLLGMDGGEVLDRFEFNHQAPFDHKVGTKTFVQPESRKFNRHRHLPCNAEASILKQLGENCFIDRLEQTWSQVAVQMECGIHHHIGKFFNIRLHGDLLIFASFAPSREPSFDFFAVIHRHVFHPVLPPPATHGEATSLTTQNVVRRSILLGTPGTALERSDKVDDNRNEMPNQTDAIRRVNPLDDPQWDAAIASLPSVSFFHCAAWARVLRASYGYAPIYFTNGEPGVLSSVLPMMEVDSWLTGRRGISLPFTDQCEPLCADAGAFAHLHRAVSEHARVRRWKYWELRGGRSLMAAAPASVSFWGHKLELQPDENGLFSRCDSSTRRAVRKAEQSGLALEFSTSLESVRAFHRLLCQTRRRHGLPPQPLHFFENIQRHILAHDQGLIVLARLNGVPVAGAVFFHFGKTAIYKFGASDESFQQFRGNNLVMWQAIAWHARRGFRSLDFGRTSLGNEGLRRFKLGWGTKEHSVDYVKFDRRSSSFVISIDESSGWHSRLFRRMPASLSQLFGAMLYKHVA